MTTALPNIAVKFDNVIHKNTIDYVAEDVIQDVPVTGAIAWLIGASELFTVNIISGRNSSSTGIGAMKAWLIAKIAINLNNNTAAAKAIVDKFKFPVAKSSAKVIIDDRAVAFNGNWSDPAYSPATLKKFKTWQGK